MNSSRTGRINDEIKRELSILISEEIKDPRVTDVMTTVTKADISNDLSHCKVYVSVLGHEKQKADALAGLKSASGFLRSQIAKRINLRATPVLNFEIDNSIEQGMKINQLIKEANATRNPDNDAEI